MAPKFDVVNEQVLLAMAIQDAEIRREVLARFRPEDFQGQINKVVAAALVRCEGQKLKPSVDSLAANADGDFGGVEYLSELSAMPIDGDMTYHLSRFLAETARSRAAAMAEKLPDLLKDRTVEFSDYMDAVDSILGVLQQGRTSRRRGAGVLQKWSEGMAQRMAGSTPFVSTGYQALDAHLTLGLYRGGVTVIGGRSRSGKSTLVADMVRRLLGGRKKPRILMVPLEGGPEQFVDSLVAGVTGIPMDTLIKYPEQMEADQREEVKRAAQKLLGDDRLEIEDDFFGFGAKASMAAIGKSPKHGAGWYGNRESIDRVEELLATGGYDVVFWDLWERMMSDLEPQKLAPALIRMQALAMKYKCHQVIVQQLSRGVEERKDQRPTLTDLKNSGAYEEIADLALLVHREKMYHPFRSADDVEVAVAKQKRGPDGFVMVADFDGATCRLTGDRVVDLEELRSNKKAFLSDEQPKKKEEVL